MHSVAVIGAGPGGLAVAKYLMSEGFSPVVFEQGRRVGGQWSGDRGHSGVWPSMRTNTSRIMTAFSDFPHPDGTGVYPTNQEMGAYLAAYAGHFHLTPCLRLGTRVLLVDRDAATGEWIVHSASGRDETRVERFSQVVIATGRHTAPEIPELPGLETFTGRGGVGHSFSYDGSDRYSDQRVLVAGCSISALEIASEIAMQPTTHVVSALRRQRYVLQKMVAGVPVEHRAFTRFSALAAESFPPDAVGAGLKDFIVRSSGHPAQFGAREPAEDVFEAGITMSQHYLPLVADGRIRSKPWIEAVDGRKVRFEDGSVEEVDAILFGTGYRLDLPFLSEAVRAILAPDAVKVDLYQHTFHPALPGLACIGLYDLVGPYFPVLELQARWIAYVLGGRCRTPSAADMQQGLDAGHGQPLPMPAVALLFARAICAEPDPLAWPQLVRELFFGPLSPASFRLTGPDLLPDAVDAIVRDARAFSALPSSSLSMEEIAQLKALAEARGDTPLARLVDRLARS